MQIQRLLAAVGAMVVLGCHSHEHKIAAPETEMPDAIPVEGQSIVGIPVMYNHFERGISVRRVGDSIELKSDGEPSHPSPYFPPTDSRYEAPPAGWGGNPNRIREQDFVFLVPANPEYSPIATSTPMGPIGMAVNGVALFNQYAFNGVDDASTESDTFDAYNGHPTGMPEGMYHYHMRPKAIVNLYDGKDVLVGVLLDGFPLYGPLPIRPGGRGSHSSALDSRNGHFSVTADHPSGIYHYHVTLGSPYFCGAFSGTPGSVTY